MVSHDASLLDFLLYAIYIPLQKLTRAFVWYGLFPSGSDPLLVIAEVPYFDQEPHNGIANIVLHDESRPHDSFVLGVIES